MSRATRRRAARLAVTAAAALGAAAGRTDGAPAPAATDAQTRAVVAATAAFLNTLSAAQRAQVEFPFTPQPAATAARFPGGPGGRFAFVGEQYGRAVWSNFPVSDVPRPGLTLGSLDAAQRDAAMRVLQTLLSPAGYQKVVDIMDADQVLSESGTPYDDGRAYYTLGVFGAPSATAPWMLQFGGHHLGVSAAVVGPNVSLTPTLTGTQPAAYPRAGRTVRPLGDEADKAFRLVQALSAAQRRKAVLPYRIDDLVLGPGHDGETLPPEGLAAAEMTDAQRALLLDLVGEWVGMLNSDDAAPKMARARAGLARTYFAWYGATAAPGPIYFRVTGPTLHIEFANQQWNRGPGGGPPQAAGVQAGGVNHVHTVYRDPTNAYGAAWRE